ncbi:hypothetical protein [Marinilabilia sp.]|uniref:hypothetical protein n=1 Tax=Marinilabilia sp. TaxID=2021252 RepID=UPI0025C6217C|nr:hypothetical protein [Marinilabilia sp.]
MHFGHKEFGFHFYKRIFFFFGIFLALLIPQKSYSCDEPLEVNSTDIIPVFLDFPFFNQYIRESLPVINYVRDRQVSQIHVKISRQRSGAGGENYVISFLGRQRFEGMNNEITFWAPASNTSDDTRRGLVERLKLGLAPYLANTHLNSLISININDSLMSMERKPMEDPWNNWVFELYGGANFYKESSQSKFNSRWGFYVDKVSKDWKIRMRPYFNINQSTYSSEEEGDIVSDNYRHGFEGYMIRSLGQHWSAGVFLEMLASTFHNMELNIEPTPGIEYSLFPYSEATEKAITFAYTMGAAQNYYMEETIFLKKQETLFKHAVRIAMDFDQPWGSLWGGIKGSHYFHDFDANRLEFYSGFSLRLVKGLSLNFQSDLDLTNDLLTIPAGDATLEELLLQERAQSTSYQIYTNVGISYRFGSEFSNVVNTRF